MGSCRFAFPNRKTPNAPCPTSPSPIRLRPRQRCCTLLVAVILTSGAGACNRPEQDLQLVGTVERTLLELVAPVPERLLHVLVRPGQHVDAGDVLARLDPTIAAADVTTSVAVLAAARTIEVQARLNRDRARRLFARDIAARLDLEAAEAALDEAVARLQESEARLTVAHQRLENLTLVAPVAGIIDQTPFDAGERVPAGALLVLMLTDSPPWVRVWLPQTKIARVRIGDPVDIHVDARPALPGRLVFIAHEAEFTPHFALTERERTHLVFEARVEIEGASDLRPGTPASVTFPRRAPTGTEDVP